MATLPIYLRLEDRSCLIVGGGAKAAAIAARLIEAETDADITVEAPDFDGQLNHWAAKGLIWLAKKRFEPSDITDQALVVAATGVANVDRLVAETALARKTPVHVVGDPQSSSFDFESDAE